MGVRVGLVKAKVPFTLTNCSVLYSQPNPGIEDNDSDGTHHEQLDRFGGGHQQEVWPAGVQGRHKVP